MTEVQLRIEGDDVVCDWGVFTNPDGNPFRPIGPLMIVTAPVLSALLTTGPAADQWNNINSAKETDSGVYFTSVAEGRSWTWKLFPAYWWDDVDPSAHDPHLFVGRWMD